MKKILVTGASGGIGLAIAEKLAISGSQLTLIARSADKLEKVVASLAGTGHQYIQADLSTQEGIDTVAENISAENYDVLINNAGVGVNGRFAQSNLDEQLDMLTLNINALVTLSHAFLKNAKSGNILMNIASTLGLSSFPGAAAYAGTKGFVIKFSESLWYENKKRNVNVIAFCPGLTKTNFHGTSGLAEKSYPDMMFQSADQVANEAIKALHKANKPTVVSGFVNRMVSFFGRMMGNKQWTNLMGMLSHVLKE